MGLNFQRKEQVVFGVSKILEQAVSAVVASLEGITVNELSDLRAACRKNGVYVYVVRNTLMCHALEGTVFKCLRPLFIGSNIIAFSTIEPADCARIFVEFSKNHRNGKFMIKGAVFDGMFIEGSKIHILSSLPTYNDCIVKLMYILTESAIGKLIRVLHVLCTSQKSGQ